MTNLKINNQIVEIEHKGPAWRITFPDYPNIEAMGASHQEVIEKAKKLLDGLKPAKKEALGPNQHQGGFLRAKQRRFYR